MACNGALSGESGAADEDAGGEDGTPPTTTWKAACRKGVSI